LPLCGYAPERSRTELQMYPTIPEPIGLSVFNWAARRG
jgi:hypothetical protein